MTELELELTRLAAVPVSLVVIRGAHVVAPINRALLHSPVWAALRAGPCGGVGRTPLEAALLLGRAIGFAAVVASRRTRAAPRSADLWLKRYLYDAAGAVPARTVSAAAVCDGLTLASLRAAACRLRVVKMKSGLHGGWSWRLPLEEVAHLRSGLDAHFGNFELESPGC